MELTAQRLPLVTDERLLRPIYPHQKSLLHEDGFKKLKVHVPTAGGKTLGALLFALRDTYRRNSIPVRAVFAYPTNLLSRDQFERSIIRGLTEWVGADLIGRGVIDPIERIFVADGAPFERIVARGTPTYVFKMPPLLGQRDLYLTVITGEGLQHLLSAENIIELGRRKGTYLLKVLEVLNQRDHIIVCSPDLLGYVAQRRYSASGTFYNDRWRDELEIKLADHQVVIDEYHFYDPYTYLNLVATLDRLGATQCLCLSATGKRQFFDDAQILVAQKPAVNDSADHLASQPIDILFHRGDIPQARQDGRGQTIWFYHSVIAAHQEAERLRCVGEPVTEWTGIRKDKNGGSDLVVATSAAEVGLDLPFRACHTEFWGNAWEIPSLIQRIGRVGRSPDTGRSEANVWITGREPNLMFSLFEGQPTLTKDEFAKTLYAAFGEELFKPEEYVSYYLWDEARTRQLRRYWQMPTGASKLRFHFRPPNSQAVFEWAGTRFVYDWIPIANRFEVEQVADITDLPLWHEMGYKEFRVGKELQPRRSLQKYEGKKDANARVWFWERGARARSETTGTGTERPLENLDPTGIESRATAVVAAVDGGCIRALSGAVSLLTIGAPLFYQKSTRMRRV